MIFKDYIQKLQQKPVRERERIAVVVTIIGFFIFVGIWIISFNEMNKQSEQPIDETSASLNDLKTNFETGKDSIQNMMQQLPSQTPPAGEAGGATGVDTTNGNNNSGTGSSATDVPSTPSIDATQNAGNNSAGNKPSEGANSNPAINTGNADQNNQNRQNVPQLP